jgi:hypothetical protein
VDRRWWLWQLVSRTQRAKVDFSVPKNCFSCRHKMTIAD